MLSHALPYRGQLSLSNCLLIIPPVNPIGRPSPTIPRLLLSQGRMPRVFEVPLSLFSCAPPGSFTPTAAWHSLTPCSGVHDSGCGCHDVRSGSFCAMPPFTGPLWGAVKALRSTSSVGRPPHGVLEPILQLALAQGSLTYWRSS